MVVRVIAQAYDVVVEPGRIHVIIKGGEIRRLGHALGVKHDAGLRAYLAARPDGRGKKGGEAFFGCLGAANGIITLPRAFIITRPPQHAVAYLVAGLYEVGGCPGRNHLLKHVARVIIETLVEGVAAEPTPCVGGELLGRVGPGVAVMEIEQQ